MAAEIRKMIKTRKPVVRQNALSNCVDFPDSFQAVDIKSQEIEAISIIAEHTNDANPWLCSPQTTLQTNIQAVKDSISRSINDKSGCDVNCQDRQDQDDGSTVVLETLQSIKLNSAKCHGGIRIEAADKKRLLSRCNKKLDKYRHLLLKRRNKERIYFDHDSSLEKKEAKETDKRNFRKRDFSDGIPVSSPSSGVTNARCNGEHTHSIYKDYHDALPNERRTQSEENTSSTSKIPQNALKKSSSLDSSAPDEGFENGDMGKRSLSHSSTLDDIQEASALGIPTLELNGSEQFLSETGKQKGETFRRSKKSSGYGTGGSEETIPEDESFSSVFLPENTSDTRKCTEVVTQLPTRLESCESLSNGVGQLLEDREDFTGSISEEARNARTPSLNGDRVVSIKDSSLPQEALIWNLKTPDLRLNSDLKRKYGGEVRSNLTPSEPGKDMAEVMRENPQRRLPELPDILKCGSSVDYFVHLAKSKDEDIRSLRSSDDEDIHPLSSIYDTCQLLMSEASVATLPHNDTINDRTVNGFKEGADTVDCQLLLSDESVATLPHNVTINDRTVNGFKEGANTVDGARCFPQNLSQDSKRAFSPTSVYPSEDQCLERAIFCHKQRIHCEDPMCLAGQLQFYNLQRLFQRDRLQECSPRISQFLWRHSSKCEELQCKVPLCDQFKRRPSCSYDEHCAMMTKSSLKQQLPEELVCSMRKVLRNGAFFTLDDGRQANYAVWKEGKALDGNLMGDFCDFDILRVRMHFGTSNYLNVVIKKALQIGQHEKNVYIALKKPSRYFVQNYWCSPLSDDRLLVCSVYYKDLKSLKECIHECDLTLDLCLTILRQALQAAMYLHSHNVVYLSWKCSGLLLDIDNHIVKLCNLNRAVVLDPGVVVNSPAIVMNTIDPCFAAPEVLSGGALGFYSDVWGLGCLLYQMVTKSKPYPGLSHQSPAEIRNKVRRDEIDHRYPEDANQLLGIFCNCWEREPARRMAIDDFLKALPDSAEVDR